VKADDLDRPSTRQDDAADGVLVGILAHDRTFPW
jgi:hypothetical protein